MKNEQCADVPFEFTWSHFKRYGRAKSSIAVTLMLGFSVAVWMSVGIEFWHALLLGVAVMQITSPPSMFKSELC